MPVVVGADGQPSEGIPLSGFSEEGSAVGDAVEQVTVPVWVRSETAGTVAIRARVVYGMGGKSPGGAVAGAGAEAEAGAGYAQEGVAVTEWAHAEVLCSLPLAAAVDVVSIQGREDYSRGGSGAGAGAGAGSVSSAFKRSGHEVAVKVRANGLKWKAGGRRGGGVDGHGECRGFAQECQETMKYKDRQTMFMI